MKTRMGIFLAFITLAVFLLVGSVAAEPAQDPASGAARFAPRPSDDLNVPAPVPGNGNWNGTMSRDRDRDGECDGMFGPDSPFYGLKLGFEDLDETFTLNETERIEKRIQHGDNRLTEMECELERNQTRNLDRILDRYRDKMNQTEDSLKPFASNDTGLLHAREMIRKHQGILQNLSEQNPDNRGLAKAYNNSLKLQDKFDEKIRMRSNPSADGNVTMPQQGMEGKGGNGVPDDKTPPGQLKQQDRQNQQGSGTADNQSQQAGMTNSQKDRDDQKQGGGNSQKDKNDQKQNTGNGRNK